MTIDSIEVGSAFVEANPIRGESFVLRSEAVVARRPRHSDRRKRKSRRRHELRLRTRATRAHGRRRHSRRSGRLKRTIGRLAVGVLAIAFAGGVAAFVRSNHAYITTPSMYPAIPPGAMVFVTPERRYRVGEVIEFHANGFLWIHRLIGIRPNGSLITKGDNPQNRPDVFVPETRMRNVVGKVTFSVRYLGFPELLVHDPGYALSWFRAELGTRGKIILLTVAGVLAAGLVGDRRRDAKRKAR